MKKHDDVLQKLRHSAAHVMADAVKCLYPGVILGIGPAIENGFYYDFDFTSCKKNDKTDNRSSFLVPEDLPKIEKEMKRIVDEKLEFKHEKISKEEAKKIFKKAGETYKLEILNEIKEEEVTLYKHGNFFDLCKGPHLSKTSEIGAFKLLSLAGAYWRGSEENQMLQRIYATAFQDKKSLDEFLKLREEAQKRDHRKLGKELDLFSFNDLVGAGLVLYHPKGAILRQVIADYITKKHLEKGYQLISSPHILKSDIWIQSGHYEYYKENMYIFESEKQEYAVKPMNCPGHILVYASKIRSYKEFPIRYFELGNVYRNEKSGVLHGLLRVRGFTQDDAHIFCLREQVEEEVIKVIDFVGETLKVFGFDKSEVELSTRPEKYIGTEKDWGDATTALKNALEKKKIKYEINEGDGAFYGPKIDLKLKDALGRSWQCATIQCDFALPERFDLKYTDQDGKENRPIVLHRVILGSLERFIGALIEHYGGDFPLWLAPIQVKIVPISEEQVDYGEKIEKLLQEQGFRVEIDTRDEKMQKKIRTAELSKIPYTVVVGKKEKSADTVALRNRKTGEITVMGQKELLEFLKEEIASKK
ncbi:MAG: threonine--tRNA ligase [Candidatus Omnitrophota bacterium]